MLMERVATSRDSGPGGLTDRAVSDMVAFVLMFAIIILGVGIASLGAFGDLGDFSDREQVESSERGMAAAASTVDALHRQDDTRRTFSLALGGGAIFLNESHVSVNVSDGVSGSDSINDTFHRAQINSLEHEFDRSPDDVAVTYEGGAVFRSPGVGVRYRPSIKCEPGGTAIVSLVSLNASSFYLAEGDDSPVPLNPFGLPGESPVADLGQSLIFSATLDSDSTTREFASPTDEALVVNVSESANPQQWDWYLDRNGWTEQNDYVYECGGVDEMLVRITTVDLSL